MVLIPGTPQDKKKERIVAAVLNGASILASFDNVATSEVLRALAHLVEQRAAREFKLCTHGCDISPSCKHRVKNTCQLKTTECEDERVRDRAVSSEGSEEVGRKGDKDESPQRKGTPRSVLLFSKRTDSTGGVQSSGKDSSEKPKGMD